MKYAILDPAMLDFLAEVTNDALLELAAELQSLDPQRNPDTHPRAAARWTAGVRALNALWDAQDMAPAIDAAEELRSRGIAPLPHTRGELTAMEREGLDPMHELGPHDPRASRPQCVHGRLFTEDCERCVKAPDTLLEDISGDPLTTDGAPPNNADES